MATQTTQPQLNQNGHDEFTFEGEDKYMDRLIPFLGVGCCSISVLPSDIPERLCSSKSEFSILCCGEGVDSSQCRIATACNSLCIDCRFSLPTDSTHTTPLIVNFCGLTMWFMSHSPLTLFSTIGELKALDSIAVEKAKKEAEISAAAAAKVAAEIAIEEEKEEARKVEEALDEDSSDEEYPLEPVVDDLPDELGVQQENQDAVEETKGGEEDKKDLEEDKSNCSVQ